jgi:hypothetical protein
MRGRIRVGTHDMGPQRLGNRHNADDEIFDLNRSAGYSLAKEIWLAVRPSDEGESEPMTVVALIPAVGDGFHG